jgi:hypothetical protein
VPFVRVSRDKRGYEHIYLVHAATRRGKPARPRILYWYRTPPGVIVGREPFDPAVRRALEAQNPDVTFDWDKLVQMTAAPPDVEPWRERRRVEREAKQARMAEERGVDEAAPPDVEAAVPPPLARESSQAGARADEARDGGDESRAANESAAVTDATPPPAWPTGVAVAERRSDEPFEAEAPHPENHIKPLASGAEQQPGHRRRRRRGGRRRRSGSGQEPTSLKPPPEPPKRE